MEKEVGVYIFAALLIAAVFFSVYFLNVKPTGFAVFQQQSQADFNGVYTNVTYDTNSSSIILAQNQTTGTYTSQILDAGNDSVWNSLTWNGTGNLQFMVRVCSQPDCSDSNFSNTGTNNINLTGRYFQYSAQFDLSSGAPSLQNVSIDYSVINLSSPANTSISVSEPSGTKDSTSGIPITLTTAGDNLTCVYNVEDAYNTFVVGNTTLDGCNDTTFSVSDEGDYTFNIYATGPSGTAYDTSSFSVTLPQTQNTTQTNTTVTTPQNDLVTRITLGTVSDQTLNAGDSANLQVTAENSGDNAISSCNFSSTGDNSAWVTSTEGAKDFSPSQGDSYSFSLNVPSETAPGEYTVGLYLKCAQAVATGNIKVTVTQKKFDFNITSVERTRSNRVTVTYSLSELTGQNQNVSIFFSIENSSGADVGNATKNNSLVANKSENFSTNIPINSSLQGNLTLSADINSETYSTSVAKPISLGAPIGGFAIFGGTGAGSIVILVILIVVLGAVFFFVRKMRKGRSGSSEKDN